MQSCSQHGAVHTHKHLLQLHGAVAFISAGTLLLDDITISSTDNTTVRTFGTFERGMRVCSLALLTSVQ
jgi:hypothetical protein